MILREKNMVSSEFMHVADAMTADMLYDAAL